MKDLALIIYTVVHSSTKLFVGITVVFSIPISIELVIPRILCDVCIAIALLFMGLEIDVDLDRLFFNTSFRVWCTGQFAYIYMYIPLRPLRFLFPIITSTQSKPQE